MIDNKKEKPITSKRLNILDIGNILLILFLLSSILFATIFIMFSIKNELKVTISEYWNILLAIMIFEIIFFWIGIILVYSTSIQLGIKLRIIGISCGMIPIMHIIILIIIIYITRNEVIFEKRKMILNLERNINQICKTKYPILMVHGVFFRDYKYFNYWGRIPAELEFNGVTIYYGNHQSAASIENSAEELANRIKQIVSETGCGKVNIIAHSKGGMDAKVAAACFGIENLVASITTINTPHFGCEFAEFLLNKAPSFLCEKVANIYNASLKKLGDTNPNFLEAVADLTVTRCTYITELINNFNFTNAGIYTQSVGSCMKEAASGAFPLNLSYHLVDLFDRPNDGLVGVNSFVWGENYIYLENSKRNGISHGDVIDLNRENIYGFDVREFYVQLVAKLKNQGL